jgi:hypothetical protein
VIGVLTYQRNDFHNFGSLRLEHYDNGYLHYLLNFFDGFVVELELDRYFTDDFMDYRNFHDLLDFDFDYPINLHNPFHFHDLLNLNNFLHQNLLEYNFHDAFHFKLNGHFPDDYLLNIFFDDNFDWYFFDKYFFHQNLDRHLSNDNLLHFNLYRELPDFYLMHYFLDDLFNNHLNRNLFDNYFFYRS